MNLRADSDKQWHLDKSVPIGIIFAMMVQFAGGLWFVSKLDSRVGELEKTVLMQRDRDQRQDEAAATAKVEVLRQLERMDEKLDRLIEKRGRP